MLFTKNNIKNSSKKQIDILDIKDNLVHLTNNRYRAILQVSTINFELMTEKEKDVISELYKSVLNSLPSSIQIYIQIRELDLKTYTSNFRQSIKHNQNYIKYKNQINNYINFIHELSQKNKILTRLFYIILPLNDYENNYLNVKNKLDINCDIIQKNLAKLKINCHRLNNLEILNLFYILYNPQQSERQPINQEVINNLKRIIL